MSRKMSTITLSFQKLLTSKSLLLKARLKERAFTRQRKLGFVNLIGILLNSPTRSIQTELYGFFDYVLRKEDISVTKAAFSKARQLLNPDVFRILSDDVVHSFYGDGEFETFHGYRILAVDGTSLELPNLKLLKNTFGHIGDANQTVRACGSILYDINNHIVIDSILAPYREAERKLLKQHLVKLKEIGYQKELLLYDRGYPSKELMAYHFEEGLSFVMRSKNGFLEKKHPYKGDRDKQISFEINQKKYEVRKVEFLLSSGETEHLVTSLMEEEVELLKQLYWMRWGIETEYDILKNTLQIENFSGYSELAIKQDFYAGICMNNLAAGMIYDYNHKEIAEEEKTCMEQTKYVYKINRNELYGLLKNKLIEAILEENEEEKGRIFERILKRMEKNLVPVRARARTERKKKLGGIKYPPNKRKSL